MILKLISPKDYKPGHWQLQLGYTAKVVDAFELMPWYIENYHGYKVIDEWQSNRMLFIHKINKQYCYMDKYDYLLFINGLYGYTFENFYYCGYTDHGVDQNFSWPVRDIIDPWIKENIINKLKN